LSALAAAVLRTELRAPRSDSSPLSRSDPPRVGGVRARALRFHGPLFCTYRPLVAEQHEAVAGLSATAARRRQMRAEGL